MQSQAKIAIAVFVLAAAMFPLESYAGWGDGDRDVDSCTSDSDFRSVISLGSNIDICIATSNWVESIERDGTAKHAARLEQRLETKVSNFCGGKSKISKIFTGGGQREKGGRHYMWVTATVKCTWM